MAVYLTLVLILATTLSEFEKQNGILRFYQINFLLILVLFIVALVYIYFQTRAISALKRAKERDAILDSFETASRQTSLEDSLTGQENVILQAKKENEKPAVEKPLASVSQNAPLTKDTKEKESKEKEIKEKKPNDKLTNKKTQAPVNKEKPKGNTHLFSLPKIGQVKRVSVGNKQGSLATEKDFIRERHLQFLITPQEDFYTVQVNAIGHSQFLFPKKMNGFKQLANPISFAVQKPNANSKQDFSLGIKELSGKAPVRFRIGDGNNFLEIHFYTYGPFETKENKSDSNHFYIRMYKEFLAEQ